MCMQMSALASFKLDAFLTINGKSDHTKYVSNEQFLEEA